MFKVLMDLIIFFIFLVIGKKRIKFNIFILDLEIIGLC